MSCIFKALAKALHNDKISHGAYNAFNKTYDELKGNTEEAISAMRTATSREHFNRARDVAKGEALKKVVLDGEGYSGINNISASGFSSKADTPNIPTRAGSIESQLRRNMVEVDQKFGTKISNLLRTDPKANEDFAKAILEPNNTTVSKEMRELSKASRDSLEEGRLLANKEGMGIGDITTKDKGYLPTQHNGSTMIKMGRDKWKTLIRDKLDYVRMGYEKSTPKELNEMLDYVFDSITTKGLTKEDVSVLGGKRGKTSLANSRQEARFLHFKDADSQIEYTKSINDGVLPPVYTTLRNHTRGLSNDIASLQILGSNPDKMFEDLKAFAKANSKADTAKGAEWHMDAMYNVARGKVDFNLAQTGIDKGFATATGTFRSSQVASQLGGATISSLTDVMNSGIASVMVGMNPIKTEMKAINTMLKRVLKGGSPAENELFASRIGIATDTFMTEIRNSRWAETGGGSESMQKVAEGLLRVSGLTAWTNAHRTTWALEFTGLLSDNIGKPLNSFRMGRRMMKQYGFTDSDWLKVTSKHTSGLDNGSFFDSTLLYKSDTDLAMRFQDMIETETNYAVIIPDARTRSITTGGKAKGTMGGEAARTVSMFKSFPIAMSSMQIGRMLQIESTGGKIAYGASTLIGMSLLGTGVVQIKDTMMKGKTPMDYKDPRLYMRGFFQGGGAALYADLLFKEQTRFGQSASEAMFLGIGAKPLNDAKRIYDGITGLKEHGTGTSELVDIGLSYVPGKNLWYTRLLYERAITDRLKSLSNPKYKAKLRNAKKRLKKESGQSYWYPPSK